MRRPTRCGLAALAILALWSAPAAGAQIEGHIVSYDCGDNCYLVIATDSGEERTGLCTAPVCDPWNEVAEMPAELVGARVVVEIGDGIQLDGNGDVVGGFDSFDSIRILDR